MTRVLNEFKDDFKRKMFSALKEQLMRLFTDSASSDFFLFGNYRAGAFDFDAILLLHSDIYLFEFKKNQPGKITVNDDCWRFSTGEIVWSGNHGELSPWGQCKEKRNVLFGRLNHLVYSKLFIKTIIVFEHPFELVRGETTLNYENHSWFLTSDISRVSDTLKNNISTGMKEDLLICLTPYIQGYNHTPSTKNRDTIVDKIRRWWKREKTAFYMFPILKIQ